MVRINLLPGKVYAEGSTKIPSIASSLLSSFIALIFIIILIYLTLKIMNNLNVKGIKVDKSENIELIESVSISRNLRIHLVKVCGREFAILEHNNTCEVLGNFESGSFKIREDHRKDFSDSFMTKLKKFGKKDEKDE